MSTAVMFGTALLILASFLIILATRRFSRASSAGIDDPVKQAC